MEATTSGSLLSPSGPLAIFILVVALQVVDRLFDHLEKRGLKSTEQSQLRQEIQQLLKEASSLSTPSTFAQAAKLRRMAATKEKELLKSQEVHNKEKDPSYYLYMRSLLIMKMIIYLGLSWWFWGVPVAAVPEQILQPFGKILSWRAGDPATGLITVGVVPWLVLTSRVGKFLCQKLAI